MKDDAPEDAGSRLSLPFEQFALLLRGKGGAPEPTPKDWKGVWKKVQAHLRRIALAPTGLVADALDCARSLVRRIGGLPPATGARVDRARRKADKDEAERQRLVEEGVQQPPPAPAAADNLQALLAALQARGLSVALRELEGGGFLIAVVRPGLEAAVEGAVHLLQAPTVPVGAEPAVEPAASKAVRKKRKK
jgi:hypothetical protein